MHNSPETCPHCASPLQWRAAAKPPILSQVLFGGSFLVFLGLDAYLAPPLRTSPAAVTLGWIWSGFQILLGAWVLWGRLRAQRRVLVCIPCRHAVGSQANGEPSP